MSTQATAPQPEWREREAGYADAMAEVFHLVAHLERSGRDPREALAGLRAYAFDAWLLAEVPVVHPDHWVLKPPGFQEEAPR